MPEVRHGDPNAWSLKDDDTAIAYMCGTAWQHDLLCASHGEKIYPTKEALIKGESCTDECGILEIEIKVRRWVQPQNGEMS